MENMEDFRNFKQMQCGRFEPKFHDICKVLAAGEGHFVMQSSE